MISTLSSWRMSEAYTHASSELAILKGIKLRTRLRALTERESFPRSQSIAAGEQEMLQNLSVGKIRIMSHIFLDYNYLECITSDSNPDRQGDDSYKT